MVGDELPSFLSFLPKETVFDCKKNTLLHIPMVLRQAPHIFHSTLSIANMGLCGNKVPQTPWFIIIFSMKWLELGLGGVSNFQT
jgi:hypothetical protein